MHVEQKDLEQKNYDLAEKFREKSKHQQQLQKLYQQLKQQQLAQGMEKAADNDADNVLHTAGQGNRIPSYRSDIPMHSRGRSNGSAGSGGHPRMVDEWQSQVQGSRAGLQTARTKMLHTVRD